MDISVIIPTWNRRDLISRAIESVLDQTVSASEVIVVDDGSTDDTAELIGSQFADVQLLQQSNQGVSAARNAGIQAANCQWIAFLDSDDEWLPQKLFEQKQLLLDAPDLQICHTDEIWIRKGRRVNPMRKHAKPEGWIFSDCLPLCCVSPSSILLHRSVLEQVGLFDEALPACEDYDLWLRIFSKFPVGLVAKPLLKKYGGHEDQLSTKYWGMDRFRVQTLVKLLEQQSLDQTQHRQVVNTLREKCNVLVGGFTKRNNLEQVDKYQRLIQQNWGEK